MGFEEATEERPPTVVAVDTADYLEVDGQDEWEDDFEMTLEERHRPPPAVPAVLVPKSARSRLREGLKAGV
ncbi:unnamed protein product [Symbiodinium microadriaticum]|nr:unnamed protein product [Symbiodinium microadriaticum]